MTIVNHILECNASLTSHLALEECIESISKAQAFMLPSMCPSMKRGGKYLVSLDKLDGVELLRYPQLKNLCDRVSNCKESSEDSSSFIPNYQRMTSETLIG